MNKKINKGMLKSYYEHKTQASVDNNQNKQKYK